MHLPGNQSELDQILTTIFYLLNIHLVMFVLACVAFETFYSLQSLARVISRTSGEVVMRNSSTNFGNHNSTGGRLLACPRCFTYRPRSMKFVTRIYSNGTTEFLTNNREKRISKNSDLFLRIHVKRGSSVSVHVTPMFLENREGCSRKDVVKYRNSNSNVDINGYNHNCVCFGNKVNFFFKAFDMFGEHSGDSVPNKCRLIVNVLDGIYSMKIQNDFKAFIQIVTGTKMGFATDYKCSAVVNYFATLNQYGLILHTVDKQSNRSIAKFDSSHLNHRNTQNITGDNLRLKSPFPAALAKYLKTNSFISGLNQMSIIGDLDTGERSNTACCSISRYQIFSPLIKFVLCNNRLGKNFGIDDAEKYFKKDNIPHFADRSVVFTHQYGRLIVNSNKAFRHDSDSSETKTKNFSHFFLGENLICLFQQQMDITWLAINRSISVLFQSESRMLRIRSSLDSLLENHFRSRNYWNQNKNKDTLGSDRGGSFIVHITNNDIVGRGSMIVYFRGFSFVPLSITGIFDHEKNLCKSLSPCYLRIRTIASIPFTMWNFGIFGGVSFNNNSGYNSDLNTERRPFRKTELDNEEGFLHVRGNTLADIIEEVPEVDCFSKTTLASTCEKMKKASDEIRKTFAGINDTSNNLATVMAGLPKMAIINGNCQGRNIHVFCPETDDCYLKPSDILSLPSKMVTDTAFQFIPIKYPLVEESYESNQMYPGFPLEMLQPQLMFAELPELNKRSQIYFRDTKKQKLQGNNKVSLKNYDQQNTKKYDELTNSNLNIREPAEHIVDCWSDDGQNKKYVKHSFNRKCKVIPRNRKPSPWKLFGKSRPKTKTKCQKQSEKEEILRRTLSCTMDGNEGNVSANDEYIPIPIKLTKFFHSLPACGSQGINKSNWIGVHMDDFEDSNSWDSKINPLEFNCGMNKKKIMKKKVHHPEHLNKPVAKPRKQKYVKPSGYELDTNSESSSIAKSECSRQPPEKYYVRESYHPKDEKAFRCYQPSNPNHYYKMKKPYHEQNRKGWQNVLKNRFKLKVHGSRAYLEPVQKENGKKIYDSESMTFLKVLPPSEEATESYMKSESVTSKIYQNHSSEEYLFKELVKIPDEFLKKSDHLSKQINVVENHVRNLEKLLTYQYHSELSAQLNMSKTDVPCTSLDNKASKTSNSGFNITHPVKQKPLKKIDLSPSDPLDLKAFSGMQNGGLEFCKNISAQELQSLFDNYLEKLQKICMTTEHTKDICSLILDIISKPDFKKFKLSSYGDEAIFKNDVLGLSNEMTLPPKNMQRNNHSRISDTTFDSSDLSITYSVVDLTKKADRENASTFQSSFQSDIFRDYKLNKLSNNNNAPFRKIKYIKKGSASPPKTRTSNSKQRNMCSYYFLKSFKINDVEKKGKWICKSCCNNYGCSSSFDSINNNSKRFSTKCLKTSNRQNLNRLVQSDSMLFKPRNKSTTSFDSLSSCQDELNSSSNERSSSFCSDSASDCFDSSCSNDAKPKNNGPNNTNYFPKSNYCYVSCCKTVIPSERFFGLHSNESSVSHGSRVKRSFFEISINNHNKKIEHQTKTSLNDGNHMQFKNHILDEQHTGEFGISCEIQNNVVTNKYEQENSELATKDTKSDISFPTGTSLWAAKNLPSKNLYLSLSDIQKLEEDEDDAKISDFFANDSKSSYKIKADSSSSSVSRRESFYSAMSCSSKKCPEVNSTIDSNSSLENNDSASSMLNYETLTFYSKLISPPHKSSVFTNANFFRESELLPQRTLSTYENTKDNGKLKNPQKMLKKGNKLGLFDWIVEQRKDFNARNGVAFVADERSGTSAISLSKNLGANRPPIDVGSILLKDRLRNFTEIQSMPEKDSMFSAKEDLNNVDASAHFVLDDKNNTQPTAESRGSDMLASEGVLGRDEQISTIENIHNKEDSWSPKQFENITETVMIPLLQNYFGEVKANCCSDDLNFTEAIVESVGFDVTSSAGVSESSNLSSNFEYIRKNDDIWNSSKSLKTIDTLRMLPEEKIDLDVNAQYAGDDVNCFEPNFESLQTILVCGTFDSEQAIDVEESNTKETPIKSDVLYSPEFLEHDSVLNTTGSCEKFTENVQRYKIHEREKFSNISGHEFKNYFQIHSPSPDEDVIGEGDSEEQNKHELDSSSNLEFHFDALINSSHVEENDKIMAKDTNKADIRKSKDDIVDVKETVDLPAGIQLPVAELIFFQKLSKTFKDNVDIFDRFCLSNENKRVMNVDVGVQHSTDDMIAKIAKESINNEAVEFVAKLRNAAVQIPNNDTASCGQNSFFISEGEELSLESETHLGPCEFNENLKVLDNNPLEEKIEVCLIESTLSTAACADHKTLINDKDDDFMKNESLEKPVNAMDDKVEDDLLCQSKIEANEIIPQSKDVSDEVQGKDVQPSLVRERCPNSDEEKIYSQAPNKDTNPTDIAQCEMISKEESVESTSDNLLSNNKFDFPEESAKVEDCRTIESAQTEINVTTVTESGKCDKEEILKSEILPRSDVEMPEDKQCAVDICKLRANLYKSKSLSLEIEKRQFERKPTLESNKSQRADVLLDKAEKMVCNKISSTSINSSWNTLQYAANFDDPLSIPNTTCDQSEAGLFSFDNVLFDKKLERENLNESDRTCTVEISFDSKETSTGNSRSLDENFLSLVNVKKLDQSQKDLRKHRAIAQRARSKKLFLGIIKDEKKHQSKKRGKENDSIQQEHTRELTLFNYNFDTGKLYEQDEMISETLEIDQTSQMDRKIAHGIQARGLKPVCQMKFNNAMKTADRKRSPNPPLTESKNSPNRDTTKRPLSSKRVPNIACHRIHPNFKENRISAKCKNSSDRTFDTSVSPNAPSKSDQEIKNAEVECFDMTKLNLHSQQIKKKLRREKLHGAYERRDSCHLSRIQNLDEMNMLTISEVDEDITPRKYDMTFKAFENHPKTRCDQAYRRWKDIQKETKLTARESSSNICWKMPAKSQILPTKQQIYGKFPQLTHDDERLSANASQSFDVGQQKSFGALRSNVIPRNLKSSASKRVEFAKSMFSNSKSNLQLLLNAVDSKENNGTENKQKIEDLEKEIALYKSRICEMKRHIHMKVKHSANGDQESRVKLYGNKNMHQHYEDLLKIFKRKEYSSKVRMNMLRHQSLLSSVRRSCVTYEKSKLHEKSAKGKRKLSRPRRSSCLAEYETKPKAKSYISSDTFADDSLCSTKFTSSGLHGASFGSRCCGTLTKQKDKYETAEVRKLKCSFGRRQRLDCKNRSRRRNEKAFGEVVQRRIHPEKGNTSCKKIHVIIGHNKKPKFKRSSSTLSTLSSDFLARKLRKPIATRVGPLSGWVRTAFPHKKT